MTLTQILGAALVSLPFGAGAFVLARDVGWGEVGRAAGLTVAAFVLIGGGLLLLGVPL